ncbi:MAG: polyprenyl synthetase family protein [Polyangiaceae bacterium]
MIPRHAREEMKDALPRIDAMVDESIASLRPFGVSPAWTAAVDATLAIHRGPKHLIRAQLVLLGSMAGGAPAEGESVETFAAGVELLHLFMLVLDDVMDNATIRRGKTTLRLALQQVEPTLDWQTARDMAVVLGSTLSMLAVRRMSPPPSAPPGRFAAFDLMLAACFHAGAGQFQDLMGFRGLGEGEPALRRALVDKTAHHSFAAPFAAGLLLASPAADTSSAMNWGEHIGVAFQATDDLTDLVTPASVTGKDALRDLLLGRPSLPLLLLRDSLSADDLAFVDAIAGKQVVAVGERGALHRIIEQSGVAAACAKRIRAEIDAAAAIADAAAFPSSAREGMRVFERSLLAYADRVVADASDAD